MIRINENYSKLKASYLFADIAQRVSAYAAANPDKPVIRLGIGDVTEPLPPACVEALHAAADEMSRRATFSGYGPEQGYAFLREAVAKRDYADRGCAIEPDEVFVSDGSKCDCGNIQEIFATDIRLAIPDPVYPVYVDTNVMAGRTGRGRRTAATRGSSTSSRPPPTATSPRCRPRRPTSSTSASRTTRRAPSRQGRSSRHGWTTRGATGRSSSSTRPTRPTSATRRSRTRSTRSRARARSRSSSGASPRRRASRARAARTRSSRRRSSPGTAPARPHALHALWNRRHTTKFNGVSYPVQRAAAAVYTDAGRRQTRGPHRLLPRQRPADPRGDGQAGAHVRRGRQRPLHLGQRRPRLLGVLRPPAREGPGRLHAGRRLRQVRRGPRQDQRVQQPRECRGGARADRARRWRGPSVLRRESARTSRAKRRHVARQEAASRSKSVPSQAAPGASKSLARDDARVRARRGDLDDRGEARRRTCPPRSRRPRTGRPRSRRRSRAPGPTGNGSAYTCATAGRRRGGVDLSDAGDRRVERLRPAPVSP